MQNMNISHSHAHIQMHKTTAWRFLTLKSGILGRKETSFFRNLFSIYYQKTLDNPSRRSSYCLWRDSRILFSTLPVPISFFPEAFFGSGFFFSLVVFEVAVFSQRKVQGLLVMDENLLGGEWDKRKLKLEGKWFVQGSLISRLSIVTWPACASVHALATSLSLGQSSFIRDMFVDHMLGTQ